ncbi:protein CUSTOS [Diretmus argenteus]
MAAPAAKMVGVSSDSSEEEDEALERCKEAVWDAAAAKTTAGESNGKQSRRVVVSVHEHDGNELQVTQGFRTHVAKKLGHMLDSYISEVTAETASPAESTKCDDNDEGFRLFTSSIPGQKVDEPPPPVRRRPVPSSSDSDSEMESRLREAAVSISDLLPSSLLPSAPSSSLTEPHPSLAEKVKKKKKKKLAEVAGEENPVPKKRKKKKKKAEIEREKP